MQQIPRRPRQPQSDGKGKPRRVLRPPKPLRPRGSLVAALDIGTTKMCCFIARVEADKPQVIGIGHQISRGLRNGTIVDLEAAGASIVNAVHAAEEMARRNDRAGRDEFVGRVLGLAHHQGRDRHRRARDRRGRIAARAGPRLSAARAWRPPGHSLGAGRVLDRRQPRHSRPARHVRRAARRQHARGDRQRRRRCAITPRRSGARISTSRPSSSALTPPGSPASSRTRSVSASPSSTWAAGRRRSACFSTVI